MMTETLFLLQSTTRRRKEVFDRLLAAYTANQRNFGNLKLQFDSQATELAELKGELRLPAASFRLPLSTF